jgi:hypothetical protein
MKLEEYRKESYEFSKRASELNRQLGFAGIALIWLFKSDVGGHTTIPTILIWVGGLIVLSLTFDMLHYCVGWYTWRSYFRGKAAEGFSEDAQIDPGPRFASPIIAFFVTKIVCIIAAYILIFSFLVKTLTA